MHTRSRILQTIRNYFYKKAYLEVETPLLAPALIPEAPIEIFETHFSSDFHGSFPLYLTPSPEVHMKKLIAQGSGDIFQISRSFRNSEQIGSQHNPEFTMLEWYTMGGDYKTSISVTEELVAAAADVAVAAAKVEAGANPPPAQITPPFRRMTVQEAFCEYAGIDLAEAGGLAGLKEAARKIGFSLRAEGETWEQLYHRIFLTLVEPNLPVDRPLLLMDYPRQIPCLAKEIPGTPWRERWELYLGGMEVANCYSEETNYHKVQAFFHKEYARKASSSTVVPDIDEEFIDIHKTGFPKCSGVALGIDRLVMAITSQSSIEGVIFFPLSDSIRP